MNEMIELFIRNGFKQIEGYQIAHINYKELIEYYDGVWRIFVK